MLLDMCLIEHLDLALQLQREHLKDRTLHEGFVTHNVLDGIVQDTRLDRREVPLNHHGILILRPVGLFDIGSDSQILLRVFAKGFVEVGSDFVELGHIGHDDRIAQRDLV